MSTTVWSSVQRVPSAEVATAKAEVGKVAPAKVGESARADHGEDAILPPAARVTMGGAEPQPTGMYDRSGMTIDSRSAEMLPRPIDANPPPDFSKMRAVHGDGTNLGQEGGRVNSPSQGTTSPGQESGTATAPAEGAEKTNQESVKSDQGYGNPHSSKAGKIL